MFARPYVAGDSLEKALGVASRLHRDKGFLTTLDLLAEGVEDGVTARRNIDTYLEMVDAASSDVRFPDRDSRPSLSLKLSSYTTDPLDKGGDADSSREAVFEIAEYAKAKGVNLTLDMESRHWTEFTIELLGDLHRAGYRHVGAVLQTRLHRTAADLERIPEGMRVRLVIGIYDESKDHAITDKVEMKRRLVEYGAYLLKAGHYVELATHDEEWVRSFLEEIVPSVGASTDHFEIQMLYGVPRDRLLSELHSQGCRVRLYVPFARSWPLAIAYLRRRLDEYPAMVFHVLRNLLRRA